MASVNEVLKFTMYVPEDSEPVFEEPSTISVPESDEVLKGSLLFFPVMILTCQSLINFWHLFLFQRLFLFH